MKKYCIILLFMAMVAPNAIHGQQDLFKWRAGGGSGVMIYIGDLNSRFFAPSHPMLDLDPGYLSYQISTERFLTPATSLRFSYTQGRFEANDRAIDYHGNLLTQSENFARSLNSLTLVNDIAISYYLYSDNDKFFGKRAFISPFVSIGASVTRFNVYGDLFGSSGDRYHYWSDNTIRSLAESDPLSPTAIIVVQDGKFETDLTALETETAYSPYTISLPLSVGLKFRLGNRININLEYALRYTLTDHLDDVSGTFRTSFDSPLQQYASNPASISGNQRGSDSRVMDMWSFTSVNLYYSFGKRKVSFRPPAIYSSSSVGAIESETSATYVPWIPVVPADSIRKSSQVQKTEKQVLTVAASDSFITVPRVDTLHLVDTLKTISEVKIDTAVLHMEPVADSIMISGEQDSPALEQRVDSLVLITPADTTIAADTIPPLFLADTLSVERNEFIERQDTIITASAYQLFKSTVPTNRLFLPFDPMEGVVEQNRELLLPTAPEEEIISPPVVMAGEALPSVTAYQTVEADMDKILLQERLNLEMERSSFYKEQVLLMRELLLGVNRKDSLIARVPELPLKNDTVETEPVPVIADTVDVATNPVEEYFSAQKAISQLESSDSVSAKFEKLFMASEKEMGVLKSRVLRLEDEISKFKQSENAVDNTVKTIETRSVMPGKKIEVPGVEIFFSTGVSDLSPIAKLSLDRIAEFIAEEPMTELIIKGFSDVTGSADRNLELSMLRAEAAQNYLMSKGVSESKIRVEFHGADLDYPGDLLRYGRRVEIIILK